MKAVFQLQIRRLIRSPLMFLSFLGLTLVFVFFLGGAGQQNTIQVNVFTDDTVMDAEAETWLDLLNEHEQFVFTLDEEEQIKDRLRSGHLHFALELLDDDYRFWVSVEEERYQRASGHVNQVFFEEIRLREAEEQAGFSIRENIEEYRDDPVLTVSTQSLATGEADDFIYDNQLQNLFGMTLYFAMFTMLFSLTRVVEEKKSGTWDRIIVSPLAKIQVYMGHLAFTFLVGYIQIMTAFFVFRYLFNYDLGDSFALITLIAGVYVFTIVSLGLLILGLVPSPERLQAVIPIAATAMAMLGGAFWPLEIVSNPLILALSQVIPIKYAMDAMIQISVYGNGLYAIQEQLGLLFLMGVLAAGIGINLMERRS
ncbi:ABC transporter permease [Salisediminibacterium beveridgei]|uniref:Putative transport permease yfiN n=1 Tax=Salisediminibacterium beveridgei TaxID=632773 RepID=A0A1D7QTD5_9BACI|nr:ABC transporter permease [Salisediminibacterium beveridgei]AOM82286.1 Putative transport permease yfiN [Salisediminibacterium beveridgei]